jgi:hypothetical protein
MSFVMNALSQYNAIIGLNNAQFAGMQNNQSRMSLANRASTVNFGSAQMDTFFRADKQLEMQQAVNGFQYQIYAAQLESLKKNQKKQIAENFNYFA